MDESGWTAGTSAITPGGGVFNDAAAALTTGQMGTLRMTPNRAQHVSIRTQAGAEVIPASFPADAAAWTTAVSTFSPAGGVFNDAAAALTAGQQGTQRLTAQRGGHVNLRNNAGTEIGTTTTPLVAQGPAATGAAVAGNPVYIGGKDGSGNMQPLPFVAVGATFTAPTASAAVVSMPYVFNGAGSNWAVPQSANNLVAGAGGGATPTAAVMVYDPGTLKFWPLEGTQAGGGFVQGPGAAGAALVGNPVQVGGSDGTNTRALSTDTSGRLQIAAINGALPAGAAVIGAVTQSGTWNATINTALPAGTNSIGTVVQGTQNAAGTASWNMQGAGAAGAAIVGNPVLMAGSDATNARALLVNTDGSLSSGGFTKQIAAAVTRPANTTTYTANTALANATSAAAQMTFSNATRLSAGSGWIIGATLLDEANQTLKGSFELWLFNTTLGTITNDNANWAPANADLLNLVGVIPFNLSYIGNNAAAASGNVVFQASALNIPFKIPSGTSLFGQLVVRNAYVPVSAEVFNCVLLIAQD